ncbi:MAG: ABC transporter permease [Bacteroidetes bacterium]|nr:ABC transporter permease [Bacteroidota bacterium]
MRKILILFKREYRAAVRTKSFIISLLLIPIMMGGGIAAMIIMENKVDTDDKHFTVIDHTGELEGYLQNAVEKRNNTGIIHERSGEQTDPAFIIEFQEPAREDTIGQQLTLSNRVKSAELYAFIEIGPGFIHGNGDGSGAYLKYYSEHSFNDPYRRWFSDKLNKHAQLLRATELNLDDEQTRHLTKWIGVSGMGLVTVDKKTGEQQEAVQSNEAESFLVPYVMMILMFMLVMMGAIPQLTAVMEEKNEKIAEVLLGSITPFQFMIGKVLGGIGVSLTTATIYVAAGVFTLSYVGMPSLIPYDVLPWFFVFAALFILMVGSGMAALGATCNDSKDASSLAFPGILPAIIPMFLMMPVIQDPGGAFATTMSLIPIFTPTLMVVRMATTVTIPLWQPIVGLIGVILFTWFTVWVGARVFRTAILIQGQKPTIATLLKYAFKA